jgi:GAF domain-containing protein
VDEALQYAVDQARDIVGGCEVADIMFIRQGGMTTPVSTDEIALALDRAQADAGEGPCVLAARKEPIVLSNDLANDDRWPDFAARAGEMGIRSALSYQLFLRRNPGDRFGALNLYGTRTGAFDDESVALGEVFAAHCATVLASAIAQEGFRMALESRDVIGQAKGVLMARHNITATRAFELLRRVSQERNVKLRELARMVAERGGLAD